MHSRMNAVRQRNVGPLGGQVGADMSHINDDGNLLQVEALATRVWPRQYLDGSVRSARQVVVRDVPRAPQLPEWVPAFHYFVCVVVVE